MPPAPGINIGDVSLTYEAGAVRVEESDDERDEENEELPHLGEAGVGQHDGVRDQGLDVIPQEAEMATGPLRDGGKR